MMFFKENRHKTMKKFIGTVMMYQAESFILTWIMADYKPEIQNG